MQEVEAICDRVIIINKGNIVADDSLQNLQLAKAGQQFVTVTFQEAIDIKDLQSLESAIHVSVSGTTFRIQTNDAENLRKQILKLSIDKNLNIVSLQNQNNSLEDVFRNLTTTQ